MTAIVAVVATVAVASAGAAASFASAYWLNGRLLAGMLLAISLLAAWHCWLALTAVDAPGARRSVLHRFHRAGRLRRRHHPFWRRLPRAPVGR